MNKILALIIAVITGVSHGLAAYTPEMAVEIGSAASAATGLLVGIIGRNKN